MDKINFIEMIRLFLLHLILVWHTCLGGVEVGEKHDQNMYETLNKTTKCEEKFENSIFKLYFQHVFYL